MHSMAQNGTVAATSAALVSLLRAFRKAARAMGSGGSVVSAAEKATTEEVREAFAALGPGEQKKAPGGRDPHGTLGCFVKKCRKSIGKSKFQTQILR